MFNAFLTRLLSAAVVVVGVLVLVFLLLHIAPGDPVELMLGESARPGDRAALRAALGLDRPLWDQFLGYLDGLWQLDLGRSLHSQQPVVEILAERLPATLELAAAALLLAVLLALPMGLIAALHKDGPLDWGAMGFSMLGAAIPNFWLGPLLILVFSLWLGWTPVRPLTGVQSGVAHHDPGHRDGGHPGPHGAQ